MVHVGRSYASPPIDTSELWWLSGGKRGDYQNCSVLYCVVKLCTVISTLRWAVFTVLWIAFCLTGPISLCIDSFVFMFVSCVFICHTAYVLYYCNTVGWTWWDWSLILEYLPLVLWHCWLGHLICKNPSLIWPIMCLVWQPYSINQSCLQQWWWWQYCQYQTVIRPDTTPTLWYCTRHRPCMRSNTNGTQTLMTRPTRHPTHVHQQN